MVNKHYLSSLEVVNRIEAMAIAYRLYSLKLNRVVGHVRGGLGG